MSEKMSNAPVYYALVQAHFNTVAMKNYVEEIQDRLRKQGYTLFEPLTTMQVKFSSSSDQQQTIPEVARHVAWLITKSNKQSGFIIANSSLTFHTTHYETHHEFIPELMQALEVVHEVVQLDHVTRVGLRYLDAVLPETGEDVEMYLAGGVHGIDVEYKRIQSLHESIFQTSCGPLMPEGIMINRIHRANGSLGFPPDMQPHNLEVMEKFKNTPVAEHAILDFDHYATRKVPIDFPGLDNQLRSLHDGITSAFTMISSDHAKNRWA